jgi:hypothetical protein
VLTGSLPPQALELEGKLVNLNPIAAAATVRLPRTQLFSSLRADYSPDCKIVCGAVHHLPADICQKWHVPPPGILPWQVSKWSHLSRGGSRA